MQFGRQMQQYTLGTTPLQPAAAHPAMRTKQDTQHPGLVQTRVVSGAAEVLTKSAAHTARAPQYPDGVATVTLVQLILGLPPLL